MRRGSVLTRAALIAVALLLVGGLTQLLRDRFVAGDVFAPYSTFRADPLGARALFDSLTLLPGMDVRRSTVALGDLGACKCTVAFLGVDASGTGSLAGDAERLARGGARVVVGLLPRWPQAADAPAKKPHDPGSLFERAGAHIAYRKRPEGPGAVELGLPRETAAYFEQLSGEWTVRRSNAGNAVAIERPWGAGSLVLMADTWLLSNEGLAQRADANELAWMISSNTTVIFDEAHLGTQESGSIAGLIRHFRLQGVLAAVIGLAVLFIWSRAWPLLPEPEERTGGAAEGHSAPAGLIGLLHRSVAPAELIGVCIQEWRSSGAGRSVRAQEAAERAAAEVEDRNDPVRAYQQLHRSIKGVIRS